MSNEVGYKLEKLGFFCHKQSKPHCQETKAWGGNLDKTSPILVLDTRQKESVNWHIGKVTD
jgi:hypothetical protein